MNAHSEISALQAMTMTHDFMVHALIETHPDPAALRSAFLDKARTYIDEQHARGDNEVCLQYLNVQIDALERMLASRSFAAKRA